MSDETVTPASAGDMDDAAARAAFESFATAKTDTAATVVADVPAELPADETPAAPAAVEVPAVTPAAAAPAAAVVIDIWASASPEIRAAHAAEIEKWNQKYNSDIGRQAAHQRTIQSLRDQLAAREAAPAASPAAPAATTAELRKNPAIIAALENYPEVGLGPVLDALESTQAEVARLNRVAADTEADRRAGVIVTQEQAFDKAYPSWREECGSQSFADWFNAQPPSLQKIVRENGEQVVNAEDAIAMFGQYRAHLALTQAAPIPQPVITAAPAPTILAERRAAQLAAVTPGPKGGPAAMPNGAPGGEAQAVFDHYADKKKAQKG